MKILHFADAHIDMANHGRHDPETGLPLRVIDFLKSLDVIIDTAIAEQVALVVFAGDAYKDRSPAPTFQREWGKRIMRLSQAGIPTLLLVGNHDLSPALGRANAVEEFKTLQVPHVRVLDRPVFLKPDDLEGLPIQVIALPWIARSGLMATLELSAAEPGKIYEAIEERLKGMIDTWLEAADPRLPVLLTAHASVQGARYGGERTVMLGGDLVLSGSLVKDQRLDYVALGHIHKSQNLNENAHPPVVYPGSIERVDWGEAEDDKYFVIAHVERGRTNVEWRKLEGIRPFIDCFVALHTDSDKANLRDRIFSALPSQAAINEAMFRLTLEYPREWEDLIDEGALRQYAACAFEFHLVKRPQMQTRIRIPGGKQLESLPPLEILDLYWLSKHIDDKERDVLNKLAVEVIGEAEQEA